MEELDPKMKNVIIGFFIVFLVSLFFVSQCGSNEQPVQIYEYEEPIVNDTIMRS